MNHLMKFESSQFNIKEMIEDCLTSMSDDYDVRVENMMGKTYSIYFKGFNKYLIIIDRIPDVRDRYESIEEFKKASLESFVFSQKIEEFFSRLEIQPSRSFIEYQRDHYYDDDGYEIESSDTSMIISLYYPV